MHAPIYHHNITNSFCLCIFCSTLLFCLQRFHYISSYIGSVVELCYRKKNHVDILDISKAQVRIILTVNDVLWCNDTINHVHWSSALLHWSHTSCDVFYFYNYFCHLLSSLCVITNSETERFYQNLCCKKISLIYIFFIVFTNKMQYPSVKMTVNMLMKVLMLSNRLTLFWHMSSGLLSAF